MIHFEITRSPDMNVITDLKYFQNQIFIGRTSGDLWIQDPGLRSLHFMLEVIGEDLLLHPQKGVEHYLINAKRASTIRKLRVSDLVTAGQTTLKILGFSETVRESKKVILNNKLNKLIAEDSLRLPVIESLTKRMK